MLATRETKTVIKLTLSEEEAAWLRGVMQNPLHGDHPADEPEEDRAMRELLWDALNWN